MKKNGTKHPWFRRRGYPHFDHPISVRDASLIVKDPAEVAKHSFFPFINFSVKTFKVKRHETTNKVHRVAKIRPIAYASHVDSHIYAYYAHNLSKIYEESINQRGLNDCVLAFRPLAKSNIDFANEAFSKIKESKICYVLALDITGFFDNIDHCLLKKTWSELLGADKLPSDHWAIFKSLTQFASVNQVTLYDLLGISLNNKKSGGPKLCSIQDFRDKVRPANLISANRSKKGIPQGSPISALLSNIYMIDFDVILKNYADSCDGHYLRYCDDILLIVPPSRKFEVESIAINEIKKLQLDINSKKTDRVNFYFDEHGAFTANKPLQYLGFMYDGKKIILRSASLAKYFDKIKRGVRTAKATMSKRNIARQNRGVIEKDLFRKSLYKRYTYLGRRNFISYGFTAARKMNSPAIRKQLRGLWGRLQNEINKE
jgi:RNA-directed DNA polymerase